MNIKAGAICLAGLLGICLSSAAFAGHAEPVILEDTREASEELYSYKDIFDLRIPDSCRIQELSAEDTACGFTAGFEDDQSGLLLYIAEFGEEETGTEEILKGLKAEEACEMAEAWRINQVDTVYFGTGESLGIAVTGAGGTVYAILLELKDDSPEQTREAFEILRSFSPHREVPDLS